MSIVHADSTSVKPTSDVTETIPVSATPTDTTDATDAPITRESDADKVLTKHNETVNGIVDDVVKGYESEGNRNFRIGKRVFSHARWQLGNFPAYEAEDFDRLLGRIADEVRVRVAISSKSIKLGEWVRCYVLKTLVAENAGRDVADSLSFFEYRTIYGSALKFSKKDVEGSLADGWLDFVKSIACDRAAGTPVSSDKFIARAESHKKTLAELKTKATLDPATIAARELLAETKAKKKAVDDANEAITTSISDAFAERHLDGPAVVSIVETVAKAHNVAMPSAFGFNPADCTTEQCELLADVMFKSGKFAEMVALRDRLDKMIAKVENAAKMAKARQDVATATISIPA